MAKTPPSEEAERERQRRQQLKLRRADQPLVDALRAAAGLPLKPLDADLKDSEPTQARRITRGSPDTGRTRLWVVVPSGIQYFRFVESGALSAIEAAYRVTYVFPHFESAHRIPRTPEQLEHDEVLFTPVDPRRYSLWATLFEVSCGALARKSGSFRIRHEMGQAGRERKAKTDLQRRFRRLVPLFASRPLFWLFRANLIRTLGSDPNLAKAMAEDRPAAIVIPSSLHDCLTNDVIATARAARIPTVVLQTSWDNISSKGVVAISPQVMGLWGEQSVKHAVELQGTPRKRCVVVGSPYYESFFRQARKSKAEARRALGLPEDGVIALFGGSFRQFDEGGLLKQIEAAIDGGRLPKMHIFYRPHPGRLMREEANFFDIDWKHTAMDPEVEVIYRANLEGRQISQNEFGYDLDRLADIYTAVDLTISPMSSIVLESLLFGLPVLGIGYSDGMNVWGPDKTSQMTHFLELDDIACVKICRSPEEVIEDLGEVAAMAARPDTAQVARTAARYFVDNGEEGYAETIHRLVDRVVEGAGRIRP